MNENIVIGLDTAKIYTQVCVMNRDGEILKERRVHRDKLMGFLEGYPGSLVAFEACGGAHHLGRELRARDFRVRLLHPTSVRPYVGVQKNDRIDARAVCEAALRPLIRSVPVKSRSQQDLRVLLRRRQGVVSERTRQINRFRGLLAEYGLVLPRGAETFQRRLHELMGSARWSEVLSPLIQEAFAEMAEELRALFDKDRRLIGQIKHLQQNDEVAQRLLTIPGVGPMITAEVMASVEEARVFASGRRMAAWVGLVPRQRSTGGRSRLGRITKRGQGELRRLLVQGAKSLIRAAAHRDGPPRHQLEAWIYNHRDRLQPNIMAIALANKIARILWVVMARNEPFRPITTKTRSA